MKPRTLSCLVAMSGLLLILSGCGESPPETAHAAGSVTLNGKPLPNASVSFIPENGPSANGVTDAQGKFTLTTFEPNDGAVVGKHKATVTIVDSEDIPEEIPDDYSYTAGGEVDEDAPVQKKQSGPSVPGLYTDPSQTPLKFEVKAGEENNFELKLE